MHFISLFKQCFKVLCNKRQLDLHVQLTTRVELQEEGRLFAEFVGNVNSFSLQNTVQSNI